MTAGEIVAILAGAGGGYWIVSKVILRFRSKTESRSNAGSHAGFGKSTNTEDTGRAKEDFETNRRQGEEVPKPWYVVLGVMQNDGIEAIRKAYRLRISEYHPDKVANLGPEIREVADRKAREINVAYEEAMKRHE